MARKVWLASGILSSAVYVALNALGAIRWPDYSVLSQTVSELSAIDAPSRSLVVRLGLAYNALLIVFGAGVWRSAAGRRALRVVAVSLAGVAVVGLVASPFAPMHVRGAERTLTDTMHIALTIVTVLFIFLAIGFGATAFGPRFRAYSLATIAVLVVAGTLTALDGPRVAANLPTPWAGLTQRINIGGYLLWVAVLAIVLLRRSAEGERGAR